MDTNYTSTQRGDASPAHAASLWLRFITLRLWWALVLPPWGHPLLRNLQQEQSRRMWRRIRNGVWIVVGLLAVVLVLIEPMLLFLMLFLGPVAYALLNTVIYCGLWCMDIAGTLSRQKQQHTADLHAVMPVGTLGAIWIVICARLHEEYHLQRSVDEIIAVMQWFLFIVLFFAISIVFTPAGDDQVRMIHVFLALLAVLAFFYGDHVQSILVSVCIGALTSRQTHTTGDARLWSLVCFLALQIGWYIGILLWVTWVLPALIVTFDLWSIWFGVFAPFLTLAIIFGLKELLIRWLWARVMFASNGDAQDLELLGRYVYMNTSDSP